MLNIRQVLKFVSMLLVVSCTSGNSREMQKDPPNIIFILTDDQGWTHTSHLADPEVPESVSDFYETPNIDRLAASGVMFTQGYAPNPICSPTRNSLITGQNAARHIYNQDLYWYRNTGGWLTIPRVLKTADTAYKTAHLGKWHIAMVPREAGFDYDDGMTSNSGGDLFEGAYLDAKDYTRETEHFLKENGIKNPTNSRLAGKPTAYWSDRNPKDIFGLTERAITFMETAIGDGDPFFIQISHYAPHLSLVSTLESYAYFQNKPRGERHTSPEYAAMLKDLDTGIGKIMDFVREAGIADNTYIFLMGDNGAKQSLNQLAIINEHRQLEEARYSDQHNRNFPLRGGKHSYYEGGLRVPFLVAGPGIEAGRITGVPVTGLDLLPTFAELAGYRGEWPEYIDGGSLVGLLFDEQTRTVSRNSEALIFHQALHRTPVSAIRVGDYKLIKYWPRDAGENKQPVLELYDLSEDLYESNDLSGTYPEKKRMLESELDSFLMKVNAETTRRDIRGPYYRLLSEIKNKALDNQN